MTARREIVALLLAAVVVLTVAGCGDDTPPTNPTPGQTWHQPGNEDVCVWTPEAGWREADDDEPCEPDDPDWHHRSTKTTRPAPVVKLTGPAKPTSRPWRAPTSARRVTR